jgi:dipeptidase E
MIGGGNTFKLLHDVYHYGLFETIRKKVTAGTPYIGWSAGANLTGLSIRTTNDMPIIQPSSFEAFAFFPFQINPHYINQPVAGFHGETRDQRLAEFVQLHPGVPVAALPEGTALSMEGEATRYLGNVPGYWLENDGTGKMLKQELQPDLLLRH